jgi:hypothetical protein
MSRIKHYRPSPAMVVALIALFVSMGGVSYGVATGSIDSREIKNNTVRSKDIRNNQVSSADVRNNSVRGRDVRNSTLTGADVGNDKLTGSDILESSLGTVPSANTANTASLAGLAGNLLGFVHTSPVKQNYGGPDKDLFSLNGFRFFLHAEANGPDGDCAVYVKNETAGDNAGVDSDDGPETDDVDQGATVFVAGAGAPPPDIEEGSDYLAVGNKGAVNGNIAVSDGISGALADCAANGFGAG